MSFRVPGEKAATFVRKGTHSNDVNRSYVNMLWIWYSLSNLISPTAGRPDC
jgi:hypothetical protein